MDDSKKGGPIISPKQPGRRELIRMGLVAGASGVVSLTLGGRREIFAHELLPPITNGAKSMPHRSQIMMHGGSQKISIELPFHFQETYRDEMKFSCSTEDYPAQIVSVEITTAKGTLRFAPDDGMCKIKIDFYHPRKAN
jgi:hypothetical protein